jgi:TetR/AcrR family transcriptional repressor of bet genes
VGRPSNREQRRAQILAAFARVLATHGYAGATVAAVAAEAGVAAGLVHHHFESKDELLSALLRSLIDAFRQRVRERSSAGLLAYVDAAVALDDRADVGAARCWVGVLAEAVRDPALFKQVRRLIDTEIATLQRAGALSAHDAGAVLAFILGALVLGAFAPQKVAGFAAPGARGLIRGLRAGT